MLYLIIVYEFFYQEKMVIFHSVLITNPTFVGKNETYIK